MLDTARKLVEEFIKPQPTDEIHATRDYLPTQYGFRAGRSTIDAIREVAQAAKLAEALSRHCRRVMRGGATCLRHCKIVFFWNYQVRFITKVV